MGKSVVCKALVEWHQLQEHAVLPVEGDISSRDIYKTFNGTYQVETFDLSINQGWAAFADWVCATNHDSQLIVNMPDSVTEKTLGALHRYAPTVEALSYQIKALFVLNTLEDGLNLIPQLVRIIKDVFPVMNLFFGPPRTFEHFNRQWARHFSQTTIYFPKANPKCMNTVRSAHLPYSVFMESKQQTLLDKWELLQWAEKAMESFYEILQEN